MQIHLSLQLKQLSVETTNSSPFRSILDNQISSFKECLSTTTYLPSFDHSLPYKDFSLGEHGRVLGSLFAHESLKNLEIELPDRPLPTFGHQEIDQRFNTDYTPIFASHEKETFQTLLYQTRGERALKEGLLDLALHDFDKVIEFNPTAPIPYLERGATYFELGDYNNSLQDYHHYTSQTQLSSFSTTPDFFLGFSKGIRRGIYDSGEGMFLFLSEFVKHPVNTGQQMWDAFCLLSDLAHNKEWEILGEILVPEMFQLVKEWDDLPSQERGELVGYAFGKHGSDILIPGTVAKAISSGIKCSQELGAVWRTMQNASKGFMIECLADCENTAQFAFATQSNKSIIALGEDLGFSYKDMSLLKEAGSLEKTVENSSTYIFSNWRLRKSYEKFANAQNFLKDYSKQYLPEEKIRELIKSTGIKTFPKPKGIPESFRVKISKSGAGMIYVHPENPNTYVRVMPGKPHSPNPCQQKPYVAWQKHGKSLDRFGNIVDSSALEAHIPIEKFIYHGN